jgi:hypothetical protein
VAPAVAGGRAGDLAIVVVRISRACFRRVISWAAERTVAPNSVTAISLLLALCAASWFSGGTSADSFRGILALGGWAATRVGARHLHEVTAQLSQRAADSSARPLEDERRFDWLFEVSTVAAECAVYGGIAAGGQAFGQTGTWTLAIVTVITVSVTEIASACSRARAGAGRGAGRNPGRTPGFWDLAGKLMSLPVAVRVVIAALATVRYGPRVALLIVLGLEVISLARTMASVVAFNPGQAAGHQGNTAGRAAKGTLAVAEAGQDVLLACRDDGPLARWTGRLVQGNLPPLPAAVLGFAAVVMLSVLGLRNLPGVIALAPALVMLPAVSGSSHPHDGRFDWLAPVLMCVSQYIYLAALGLAHAVSGLAIFATCSIVAVWYAGLAARPARRPGVLPARREQIRQIVRRRADGLGWEARVCAVGLTGMFGIATFGYLGLAAYLAALMCRKVVISYLIPQTQPS